MIVAIDYFTKWIEAKLVAAITRKQMMKFVWDNIVCRFGLPGEIISDNGKHFRDDPFKTWCKKLNIIQHFASVKHPHSNALVERENRSLEAVIPVEIGMPSLRCSMVDKNKNDEGLLLNLDLLEEKRELAATVEEKHIRKMESKQKDTGKLSPKWEGPYKVTKAIRDGAYKLRD
ncbi:reverse transcriptase domain-containing protein [Tanacetum coccineum]